MARLSFDEYAYLTLGNDNLMAHFCAAIKNSRRWMHPNHEFGNKHRTITRLQVNVDFLCNLYLCQK